ncbi:MAG: ribosome assembly cofactor RimP, partial [Bacteroidales bacterium]|nr:ribosome assembly cofactor RimP [Bacteroidales bacterium]
MIAKEQITVLCEEALAGTDRFLVEVKVKPNNVIEVYVDSDTAVNIDHCAEL